MLELSYRKNAPSFRFQMRIPIPIISTTYQRLRQCNKMLQQNHLLRNGEGSVVRSLVKTSAAEEASSARLEDPSEGPNH